MNATRSCPQCGESLPADAPAGLCPKCLLKGGLATDNPQQKSGSGFTPPSVEDLARRFPQLEILELLGQGGMGAVYKARQKGLDRLVAVKILPPQVGRDPSFAERFNREARALGRLSHPNIVAVHEFGQTPPLPGTPGRGAGGEGSEDEGLYYFVMEYIDGASLRETISAGALRSAEALAIVPQICDALQFAHDEGVVHRDIKPENILLDKKGRVKIADFGISKLLGEDKPEHTLTGEHQVMGTLRYMAPEQMQGSHFVDHRADIYSLGVVFYELLTGKVPAGSFEPPSRKVQIDVRLDEVVLRTLAQEPDKRYQRASEVKTDVEALSKTAAVVSPAPAPVAAAPAGSSNTGVVVVIVALLLALTCVPLVLVMFVALGVSVFWVAPSKSRDSQPQMMESAEPIATPGRIVMPARDHDEARTAGSDFVLLLIGEQWDEAFDKLSATHEPREEALAAWKQSIQSKPEYIRLRELVKEGMGNSEAGQFDDEGRYLYRWICGVAKSSAKGRGEIEVHLALAKEGQVWKVEGLQFERN